MAPAENATALPPASQVAVRLNVDVLAVSRSICGGSLVGVIVTVPLMVAALSAAGPPALPPDWTLLPSLSTTV